MGDTVAISFGSRTLQADLVTSVLTGSDGTPLGTSTNPLRTDVAALPNGTDRSGTAGTSSTTLAAANSARKGLNIQNVSANSLGVNEFGGTAAIGSAGTYTVPAGGSLKVNTNRQVTVIASAANSPYSATEF